MLFSAKFVACRHTGGGQQGGWRQGKETNEVWGCLREECSLPFLAVGLFQLPCSEPAVGCVPSQREAFRRNQEHKTLGKEGPGLC